MEDVQPEWRRAIVHLLYKNIECPKFHGSGYVRRSDQISPFLTPSNSRRYHFTCTNSSSEGIKQNLSSLVSLRFLRVFNPSRLPIIYLFNRIYNLNMILFHHILWPYVGGGGGVSSANLHILHSQHDSSEYTQLGYNLFTFGFNHCWSKLYLHSVELLEFVWNTHLLELYQRQTRRKKALIPTCDLYSFDVCATGLSHIESNRLILFVAAAYLTFTGSRPPCHLRPSVYFCL